MIDKFETMVSDGIPVTSRLRTMRIQESVGVRKDSFVKHRLLINSAYAPTDCDDPQDEFNEELDTLVRKSKSLNIAMVVEDHNAQVGKLDALEACLGGQCALLSKKNGGTLVQFCADNHLFLSSFRHSSRRTTKRCYNFTGSLRQLDHIVVSYCWRGFVQKCRSY